MRPTLSAAVAIAFLAAVPASGSAGTPTPLGCTKDPHADSTFQHCASSAAGLNGAIGAVVSPDSRNLYVTTETAGELTTFDRDASTGRIQQAGCFKAADWTSTLDGPSSCTQTASGINGAVGVAISPDGTSVYTGGVNDSAVAEFARDPSTGGLHEIGCIEKLDATTNVCPVRGDGLGGARAVAVSPDGRNVYVGTHGHALSEFVRNTVTGVLTQLPAPDNCIEDPADNNTSSGIVNGTGKATCTKTASGLAYVRTVTVSPDGRNVYAATDFGQAISQFARDLTTGALTPLGCIRDPAGPTYESCSTSVSGLGWVFGIAISPDGRFAYSSADGIINVFSRDSTGVLHRVGCVNTAGTSGCAQAKGIGDAEALTLSPDGGTLYAAAFRGGDFAVFHRDETTGMLTEEGCVEAEQHSAPQCAQTTDGIYQPRVVAPSPDRRSLYVTTSVGADVAAFDTGYTPPKPPPPPAPPPPVAKAAASHPTSVTIAVKRVRAKRRAKAAASRPRLRIAGAVRGAGAGRVTLQLQRRRGRRWATRKRLVTAVRSSGAYSRLTRVPAHARWRVRAVYTGAADALPSASRYVAFPRTKR